MSLLPELSAFGDDCYKDYAPSGAKSFLHLQPAVPGCKTPIAQYSATPSLRLAGFEHRGDEAVKPDFGFIDCATTRIGTRWRYEAFPRFGDRCGLGERACGYGL